MSTQALRYSAGDWLTWDAAVPSGVTMTTPFFDPRVLSAVFSLPGELHAEPWPMKPVLAAALEDVLPDKLRLRSRKIHFGIFIEGMARRKREIEGLIRESSIDDAVLDKGALLDALGQATLGLHQGQWTVGRLRLALSYVHWLSTRDAWRREPDLLRLGDLTHAPASTL